MAQQRTLEDLIDEYQIDITPDNQIRIGSTGQVVPVPSDSRVDLATYIDGVVRSHQRIQSGIRAGQYPLKATEARPTMADAAINKIRSYGAIPAAVTDVGVGALKGAGATSSNIARMVPGVRRAVVSPEQQQEMLAPASLAQSVGRTAEQIGEYVWPGGAAARGVRAAISHPQVPIQAIRMIPEMAASAGVATAQGDNPNIAAVLGGLTPQMLSKIGRMAEANPAAAAKLIHALGLGGVVGMPALWEKFVSALGMGIGEDTVVRLGQALQHVGMNRPVGRGIGGAATRFLSKLEGYRQ